MKNRLKTPIFEASFYTCNPLQMKFRYLFLLLTGIALNVNVYAQLDPLGRGGVWTLWLQKLDHKLSREGYYLEKVEAPDKSAKKEKKRRK